MRKGVLLHAVPTRVGEGQGRVGTAHTRCSPYRIARRRAPLPTLRHAHQELLEAVEAFARAITTETAFPIAPVQMLDTIGAFEAVIEAANTGRRVTL
jgi:predicted dehydrogenase